MHIFVSLKSGVGVGGAPKEYVELYGKGTSLLIHFYSTPFGLYRDGTELRGVYYAHPEVGKAACDSLKDQCDYPILLGEHMSAFLLLVFTRVL